MAAAKLLPLMLAFRSTVPPARAGAGADRTVTATATAIDHMAALTPQTVDGRWDAIEVSFVARALGHRFTGRAKERVRGGKKAGVSGSQFSRLSRRQNNPDPMSTKKMIITTVEASL